MDHIAKLRSKINYRREERDFLKGVDPVLSLMIEIGLMHIKDKFNDFQELKELTSRMINIMVVWNFIKMLVFNINKQIDFNAHKKEYI